MPLDDHGVLVFREDGSLADYHAPVPGDDTTDAEALALLAEARRLGVDRHGARCRSCAKRTGASAWKPGSKRGNGPSVWVDAFTRDAPQGERRKVVSTSWGSHHQARKMERAGIVLGADAIGR